MTVYNYKTLYGKLNKDNNIKKLNKNLQKYGLDINSIKLYIIDIFKNVISQIKENINNDKDIKKDNNFEIIIDIYSPLFEILSRDDIFGEIFSIPISIDLIEKYNLTTDYITAFNELNKNKSKYSSIQFFFKKETDLEYFQKFQINLNQIKILTLKQDCKYFIKNYDIFFKQLFEFKNMENNLLYLIIDILPYNKYKINKDIFNNINNLKSLKYLLLSRFNFQSTFKLNLTNLSQLILIECKNIKFGKNIGLNIQKLYLNFCSIVIPKKLRQFPKLEVCKFEGKQQYNSIIDFSNLQNLKNFKGDFIEFRELNNDILEYVKLTSYEKNTIMEEVNIIRKLISYKSLKEVYLDIYSLNHYKLTDNNDIENNSIETLTINWKCKNDCILNNLLNKLKNLSNLTIINNLENRKSAIIINQNINCKIKRFSLYCIYNNNIKFYCQPFEYLIEINLSLKSRVINIDNILPLFNEECKVIFKSLIKFTFSYEYYNKNILENLSSNILCMPKLKEFSLEIPFLPPNKEVDILRQFIAKNRNILKNFFDNVSNLSLNSLNLKNKDKNEVLLIYTKIDELKENYPNIKLKNNCIIYLEI